MRGRLIMAMLVMRWTMEGILGIIGLMAEKELVIKEEREILAITGLVFMRASMMMVIIGTKRTLDKMYGVRNRWRERQAKTGVKEIWIKNEIGSGAKTMKRKKIPLGTGKGLETEKLIWTGRHHGGSRDRDLERERERRREKDCGRSRDRDLDRERSRGDSISMYRNRDTDTGRERNRSRKLEVERGRDRYYSGDRHRDKARDDESGRNRSYHKYNDHDDSYGNRDRRRGYNEAEYYKDRKTKNDPEKHQASKDDSLKENNDGLNGDDDDQKDYQEILESKPADHEEDDVNRVKEESRRLREAVLQKYKAQKLQHQQQVATQGFKDVFYFHDLNVRVFVFGSVSFSVLDALVCLVGLLES